MRRTVLLGAMSVWLAACDYKPLPKLGASGGDADGGGDAGGGGGGQLTLVATPAAFLLHKNDTRGTALRVSNATDQPADVGAFAVQGLAIGTMAFASNTCPATLAPGASCSAIGHLVATSTGDASFQVTLGAASAPLTMTVMRACPQTCGPGGAANCCDSEVVPGNADGATRAGEIFHRSKDPSAPASIGNFRLDRYEVTVGRFRAFVEAGMGTQTTAPAAGAGAHARIPGSGWAPAFNASLPASTAALVSTLKCNATYQTWTDAAGANEGLPINCITWWDAMAFCALDGGYLPTEAEWDYAASGGAEQRTYPWSSPPSSSTIDCSYANYEFDVPAGSFCVNGMTGSTNRVGSESPKGDSRWGQADMAGNLLEWTLDWYKSTYPVPCIDCATLATLSTRVVRGGSFLDGPQVLETPTRSTSTPNNNSIGIGVRCARMP